MFEEREMQYEIIKKRGYLKSVILPIAPKSPEGDLLVANSIEPPLEPAPTQAGVRVGL